VNVDNQDLNKVRATNALKAHIATGYLRVNKETESLVGHNIVEPVRDHLTDYFEPAK